MKKKKYILEEFSFFIAKVLKRLPINEKIKIKFNKKRHSRINQQLQSLFELSLSEAKKQNKKNSNKALKNSKIIWVFWWQGKKNMPSLVRACYNSLQENSSDGKVILITQKNYSKYTDISPEILTLLKNKKITLTHFSDILRFNLLKNYGGLWLDATIFVNKPITKKYFQSLFTCSGYDDNNYFFVTKGNWCGFLIGGTKNNILFTFMDIFFKNYWKENTKIIDYFLIDYALNYAWEHNLGHFRDYTKDNLGKNNPFLFDLAPKLNAKFEEKKWQEIQKNTEMYKLSYKIKLVKSKDTFYNKIVNPMGGKE